MDNDDIVPYILPAILIVIFLSAVAVAIIFPSDESYPRDMEFIRANVNKQINENTTVSEKLKLITDYCTAYSFRKEPCINDLREEMFTIPKE